MKNNFKETFQYLEVEKADKKIKNLLEPVQGGCDYILYFDGDVYLDEDLDFDFIVKFSEEQGFEFQTIVVNGNLTVNGRISMSEEWPGLVVNGFTKAETLESGDAEVYIGDGAFDYFIYGYCNDGTLIAGNITTPLVLNSDHLLDLNSEDAIFIDLWSKEERSYGGYDYFKTDVPNIFVKEVFDDDYVEDLDFNKLYEFLKEKKQVFKIELKRKKESIIHKILQDKDAIELNIRAKRFASFPKEILKLNALEYLNIKDNYIETLPDLSPLKNLKKLEIVDNPLKSIPKSIVNLKNLEELNLDSSLGFIDTLPDLSELPNLRILHFEGTKGIKNNSKNPSHNLLRQLFKMNLTNLEELNISFWEEKEAINGILREKLKPEFLKGIGKFKNLKKIDLTYCNLNSLPEEIFLLKNLERLVLDDNNIPELQIKKLKKFYPNVVVVINE